MSFQDLLSEAQKDFPKLQIKYKDQSLFMKILGVLLFFNKAFMTSYVTTIGSTVYFPDEESTIANSISSAVTLLHELTHIKDSGKFSQPIFSFLYLLPQILILFCIPLFFVNWILALSLIILFALPLPAFFRMYFERRGYMVSLYAIDALSKRMNFNPLLLQNESDKLQEFSGSDYYYMWPFKNLQKDFDQAVNKIKAGQRPFEDPLFDVLDKLISKV